MENLQGGTLALEHRYHLDRQIDSFGLVTVYAGTQEPFGLPVQITVYDGLLAAGADSTIVDRIKESARQASLLEGEGLLAVVDFGEIEQDVPFVIEQAVEGPSLATYMERQDVLAPDQVLALVGRLADLLDAAHKSSIYHGDLRPEWILLPDESSPLAQARLSHFGLHPSMRELVAMPQAVLTTDLVESFPPECFDVAARDQDDDGVPISETHLTAGADQWALAAVAYRLLVGVHPFFDDPVDASEGILRIKTEDPPSLVELGIDAAIADVIDRALSADPGERWPTIADFHLALKDAIDGPSSKPAHAASGDATVATSEDDADAAPAESTAAAEPLGPRPSGYLLTVALAGLFLSNLAWFFLTMADADPVDEAEVDAQAQAQAPAAEILPLGLQLETTPSDAELFILRDDIKESLGFTPRVIADSMLEDSTLELMLRHANYHDQPLTITETDTGQNVRLHLIADGDAEPDVEADDDGDGS